ncbi:hypothetical protein L596_030320 [Steinernema carpocapsae]|uniref:Fibronectin type-III domain-containing protein n=1 Tax=Steinernema carpocapsae TaxID=34508 RepID=A0A4U5LP16_STECR|nr:hypothetical protein L596_030320 [Steinernema carpocapsae]
MSVKRLNSTAVLVEWKPMRTIYTKEYWLAYTDSVEGAQNSTYGYDIFAYTKPLRIPRNQTSRIVSGLNPEKTYYFEMCGSNDVENSDATATIEYGPHDEDKKRWNFIEYVVEKMEEHKQNWSEEEKQGKHKDCVIWC